MTDDLVARVRSPFALTERDAQEIADALEVRGKRIDELESWLVDKDALIAELEAALKPFADKADQVDQAIQHGMPTDVFQVSVMFGHLRAARTALKGEKAS